MASQRIYKALVVVLAALPIWIIGCDDPDDDNTADMAGTTDNGGGNDGSPVDVTLSTLCADPSVNKGLIRVPADAVNERSTCTLVGCDDENQCCGNACWVDFVIDCPDGSPVEEIVLVAGEGSNIEPVTGTAEGAGNENLAELATDSSTKFGCVGIECYLVCTPGPLDTIDAFVGTVVQGETTSPSGGDAGGPYPAALHVTSVDNSSE